jgi:hypothetical protein
LLGALHRLNGVNESVVDKVVINATGTKTEAICDEENSFFPVRKGLTLDLSFVACLFQV